MHKLKKIAIISLILSVIPVLVFSAAKDDFVYTYELHLYYDNGVFVKDRDFESIFDLIAQEFEQQAVDGPKYSGEVISINGNKLAGFDFGLTEEILKSNRGKLTVLAPFFTNAKTGVLYGQDGKQVFVVDLAPFGPVCNEDGTCNSEFGEDTNNCPNDCKIIPIAEPSGGSNLTRLLMIGGGAVVVILAAWLIIRSRRRRQTIPEISPKNQPLPTVPLQSPQSPEQK